MKVLKCQHHVCFNDEPKSCLSVSSGDRQSIKGHRLKYNFYTDLLSVLMLLCCVVNCSPVYHLSHILAHLSQRLIGELIGYSWSGVSPSSVRRKQFQTSPKPLARSKPNFMWSLLG